MTKYIITQDFTASEFFMDRPSPSPKTKDFKSGEEVEAEYKSTFGGAKLLVSSDGFVLPYDKIKSKYSIQKEKAANTHKKLGNVVLVLVSIGVIIGIVKSFR